MLRYVYSVGCLTGFVTLEEVHREVAKRLSEHRFKFYFVFSQPDLTYKTRALIALKELLIPDLDRKVGVLISFATIDGETIECMRLLKQHGFEIMVDSGAFHVLEKKLPLEKYMEYLDRYIKFVNTHDDLIDWFVTMDIPCDARPAESIQEMPNLWKIELTVDNTIRIYEKCEHPEKLIAVVQGYHPHEYEYCCQLLREHGLITARVGVGSLCIRKYSKNAVPEVRQILETIRRSLPGWVKIHTFGLAVDFLEHREIAQHVSSSDSGAWVKQYSQYARLKLYRVRDGTMTEIDTKDITRRFKKIDLDTVSIYFYTMLTYILKLRKIGLI